MTDFYIVNNGHKIDSGVQLENGRIYHVIPRLIGGKGGFGSMLRAIGAQIEKTTSREACRDLSGRRMRDINNEKKLKEWLSKESEREKEKEERRQEKIARELNSRHKFEDKEYVEQKAKVQEDLEAALNSGLKRVNKKGDVSSIPSKKSKGDWLGMDLDSDDLESDSDSETSTCKVPKSEETKFDGTKCSKTDSKYIETDISYSSEKNDCLTGSNQTSDSPKTNKSAEEESEAVKCENDSKNREAEIDPQTPIDLDLYESTSELCQLGLDRLKFALLIRGMKCGGTLEERATRLFCVKGIKAEDIDPALLAKGKGKGKKTK